MFTICKNSYQKHLHKNYRKDPVALWFENKHSCCLVMAVVSDRNFGQILHLGGCDFWCEGQHFFQVVLFFIKLKLSWRQRVHLCLNGWSGTSPLHCWIFGALSQLPLVKQNSCLQYTQWTQILYSSSNFLQIRVDAVVEGFVLLYMLLLSSCNLYEKYM